MSGWQIIPAAVLTAAGMGIIIVSLGQLIARRLFGGREEENWQGALERLAELEKGSPYESDLDEYGVI